MKNLAEMLKGRPIVDKDSAQELPFGYLRALKENGVPHRDAVRCARGVTHEVFDGQPERSSLAIERLREAIKAL